MEYSTFAVEGIGVHHLAPLAIALAASATAIHAADLRFGPCPAKRFTVTEDPPRPTACATDSTGVVRAVLYSRHGNEVAVFADGRRYVQDDPPTATLWLSGASAPSPSVLFGQVPPDLAERIAVAAGLRRDVASSAPFLHAPPASRPPERLAPRTPQVLVRYQYDWRGRVSMKIGAEGVRQYVYDGDSERVLNEFDGQDTVVASYQWAGDRLVSITRPGQGTRYPAYDGLGSVVGLTDETGAVTARYHYDAGGSLRDAAELAADPNRYAFTGHRFEAETGFYRAGARYLAPDGGRFVTQDSYLGKPEEPFSLHRYLYAAANPLRYVDPTGHYQADVHYGLTKVLALKAGLAESVAEAIARGAEAPDVPGDGRHPVENGKVVAWPAWTVRGEAARAERRAAEGRLREWHFPRDAGATEVVPGSAAAASKFEDALATGNPIAIGESLHPFQDSWSHQGHPSLNGVAGHPDARGGLLSTKADETAAFPQDARTMARETYRKLVRVGEQHPTYRAQAPAKFREFQDDVAAFIGADSKQEKRNALDRLGVTMPAAYWDDVTLPAKDSSATPPR